MNAYFRVYAASQGTRIYPADIDGICYMFDWVSLTGWVFQEGI